jgi:hypothetical protein
LSKEDREYEEWLHGWNPPSTDAEIAQTRERASGAGDRATVRLTSEIQTLRYMLKTALACIDGLGSAASSDEREEIMKGDIVRLVRFMAEARKP